MKKKEILIFIPIVIISLMISFSGCRKDEIIDDDDNGNTTELEVNNYLLVATGQTKFYDNYGEMNFEKQPFDSWPA